MPSQKTINILKEKHDQLAKNNNKTYEELKNVSLDLDKLKYETISDIRKYVIETNDEVLFVQYFKKKCLEYTKTNFISEFLEVKPISAKDKSNPLYGVPISVKEALAIKGLDSTCGLAKFCLQPKEDDSVIVKVLREIGAIPFITTSMAQGGLSIDSSNPVFGIQENPRFKDHLAGGSSGGEGIALSLGASPIGIGTDIGGSIRFPAAFNGILGLKPTRFRLSSKGHFRLSAHPPVYFRVVIGPMGRKTEDLADFMRGVLCDYHFKLDPEVVPIKFNEENYKKSVLKVGYYDSFGEDYLPETVPGVKRAVKMAVDILKSQGHEVRSFNVPEPNRAVRLGVSCLFADGGKALKDVYKDENLDASNVETGKLLQIPRFLRKLFGWLVLRQYGEFASGISKEINGFDSYLDGALALGEVERYRSSFLEEMGDLDVIICPLFPVPIPKKQTKSIMNNLSSSYSFLYNMLDLPAGVVPVDATTNEDNESAMKAIPKFKEMNDILNLHFHENQKFVGQPLYVQVAGKPYQEEIVLCAMKQLEEKSQYKFELPENI